MRACNRSIRRNVLVTNWGTNSSQYVRTGIAARKKARLDIQATKAQLLQGTFHGNISGSGIARLIKIGASREDVEQLEDLFSGTLGSTTDDWEDEPATAQSNSFQDEDLDYEQLLKALSSLSPKP